MQSFLDKISRSIESQNFIFEEICNDEPIPAALNELIAV